MSQIARLADLARPHRAIRALSAVALAAATLAFVALLGLLARPPLKTFQPSLSVENLVVSPVLSTSPATVIVQGRLRNLATTPARQIRIGLSAADPGRGNRWVPLQIEPRGSIGTIESNAAIPFQGAMRLEGRGRFSVGVVAVSDDSLLPPQLRTVWLFSPAEMATETASVFATYLLLLGVIGLALYLVTRRPNGGPAFDVRRRHANVALAIAIAGPVIIWSARVVLIRALGPGGPRWIWAELPWLGSAAFALGWLIFGSALRPGGSRLRGLLLAAALYVVVGIIWTLGLQLAFGRPLVTILADTDVMLFSLLWPMQVAQISGLFGLSY